MRVVFDPNVLVSAAVASGVSDQLLDRWLTDRPFELVVCPALIGELRDVLTRDRFRRWISTDEAELFVTRLESEAEPSRGSDRGPARRVGLCLGMGRTDVRHDQSNLAHRSEAVGQFL